MLVKSLMLSWIEDIIKNNFWKRFMEDRDEESKSLPKEIEEQEPISATEIVAPDNSWKGGERHDTTLWRTKGFASEKTYRRFLGLD